MSQNSTFVAWVGLSLVPRVGGKLMSRLLEHFNTPEAVLAAPADELKAVPGIGPRTLTAIQAVDLAGVVTKIDEWQAAGFQILPLYTPDYPALLKAVHDAPPLLFKRGNWVDDTIRTVAIVGTREPTPAAAEFAHLLGEKLAGAGWIIVSGLALGIDTQAHRGALKKGQTVAVLGCGLNSVYPPENQNLASQICEHGALFSEVAPEVGPGAAQLVARNRITSGLSHAVILVESAVDGGAIHTTRFAKEQGRPIFVADFGATGNQELKAAGAFIISPNIKGIQALLKELEFRK
jgi:DNA processing protein